MKTLGVIVALLLPSRSSFSQPNKALDKQVQHTARDGDVAGKNRTR